MATGKAIRTAIFWLHLATGVCVGVVVFVMSVTGVLLAFQPQVQEWADTRGMVGGPPAGGMPLLEPDELVTRASTVRPGAPTAIRLRRAPDAPVELEYGRDGRLFVNGYTGTVLGEGSERTGAFFSSVTGLHRWLVPSGNARRRGRTVTGAANLAFLFMVCSGLILWWPRNVTSRAFRSILLFRRGLRAKARDFNWHNVVGIWSFVPLTIIIASATVISYGWAGRLAERAAGIGETGSAASSAAIPAARPTASPTVAGAVATTAAGAAIGGAAAALAQARRLQPQWKTITLQLPARGGEHIAMVSTGAAGQPQRQARLRVDATTGAVTAWEPFESRAAPERMRSILRYAHTGEVLGIAGQAIAGLASGAAALLVFTGLSLALRRLVAWRARRRRPAASP